MNSGLESILRYISEQPGQPGQPLLLKRYLSLVSLVDAPDQKSHYLKLLARTLEDTNPELAETLYKKLANSSSDKSGNSDQTIVLSNLEQSILEKESIIESIASKVSQPPSQPYEVGARPQSYLNHSRQGRVMRDQQGWAETFVI